MKDGEFFITTVEEVDENEEVYPPPGNLKGLEISGTGWRIKKIRQDDDKVVVTIYCKSKARDWYSVTVRLPKDKLKLIGG